MLEAPSQSFRSSQTPVQNAGLSQWLGTNDRLIVSVLLVVAIAGIVLAELEIPDAHTFLPAMYGVSALLDFATFAVLLRARRFERSYVVLAVGFALSGLFALTTLLCTSWLSGLQQLPIGSQSGIWLYLFAHIFMAVAIAAYSLVRRSNWDSATAPRRFTTTAWVIAGSCYVAAVVFACAYADRLPHLLDGLIFTPLLRARVGVVVLALGCLSAILPWCRRRTSSLDRVVSFSAFALTLELLLDMLANGHLTFAWFAAGVLAISGSSFVLVGRLSLFMQSLKRLSAAEREMIEAATQSAKNATRIRAIWRIATSDAQSDADHASAILEIATANIRPGKPIFGYLSHLDRETIVVDATAASGDFDELLLSYKSVFQGHMFPIGQSIQSVLADEGHTMVWNDLEFARTAGTICAQARWRSLIGTPIDIGTRRHFLIFASPESMAHEPFAEDDVAFVDVTASHFTSRFYQQDQLARLRYQMGHDALTGLVNRNEFLKSVRMAALEGTPFGIALIDLDRFRDINESAGHLIGDEILVEVAATLASVDERDLVARLGSDDFAVLLYAEASEEALATRLDAYTQMFRKPFHTGDRDGARFMVVASSLGAALYPRDAATPDDLIHRADVALDVAKERGGSMAIIFAPDMEVIARARHDQIEEMIEGFGRDEFVLEYQPTFEIATRHIIGAEALIRWNHPLRGRLMPAGFIPFAERNGLINLLSRWVLARVARDLGSEVLPAAFRCYFNLPARLLDDTTFVRELEEQLTTLPGLASHLGIELTESEAMQDVEKAIQSLHMMRRLGLRVAIDDFGTGHSSMAYLKRLPIDIVKIDRSFIGGLPADPKDRALAEMFLRLTKQLNFVSLAEGIETESRWLSDNGCLLGQGYLFAKALPLQQLLNVVNASERAHAPVRAGKNDPQTTRKIPA
jgi:diguanylate cyclase (GGDEF)-like protein